MSDMNVSWVENIHNMEKYKKLEASRIPKIPKLKGQDDFEDREEIKIFKEILDSDLIMRDLLRQLERDHQTMISSIELAEEKVFEIEKRLEAIEEILVNLESDISMEERYLSQDKIDKYTEEIDLLSDEINREISTENFSPESLGISTDVRVGDLSSIVIKNREPRGENITILYTGSVIRVVRVRDSIENSGIKLVYLNKKDSHKNYITASRLKETLDQLGFYSEVVVDNVRIPEFKLNFFGDEAYIEKMGLNIFKDQGINLSIENIKYAGERLEENRHKLEAIKEKLSQDLREKYTEENSQWKLESLEDANETLEEIRASILEEMNYREYINRSQNPDQVYKLLK